MTTPPRRRGTAGSVLVFVLAATAVTLAAGAAIKAPCAVGNWSDGRQYTRLCYSDIVPLYGTEHLQGGRVPFINACPAEAGDQCDEYPVLTMYLMRVAAWPAAGYGGFFWTNALLLGVLGLATALMLYRMAGERALYFAVAPTLLVYAFVNWDLLAVALATAGTLLFFRRRDEWSGAMLGLGAAAKLYPAFLVIPFALERVRQRRPAGGVALAVWAAVAFAAVNVPFALAAPHSWFTFFRFNADRVADFDSLWYIACHRLRQGCSLTPRAIDWLSVGVIVAVSLALWWARRRRVPDFPRWTFGFPLLVTFLLVNKVYSPQYGLWLLPWFVLALPNLPLFVAFEATDVAVFVTRFSWFGRIQLHVGGAPEWTFQLAVAARALVLVACLVWWVLRQTAEELEPEAHPAVAAGRLEPEGSGA